MRPSSEHGKLALRLGRLAVLVLVTAVLGCGASGVTRRAQVENRDENGFTVLEDVRIGIGVRSDFRKAIDALSADEHEGGIELLLVVAEDVPNSTTVQINLAIAYGKLGDLENAEASIDRALELNSRHPAAHNERGILHRRRGRFVEARESYEAALSIFPNYHLARRNLAILCDLYLLDPECALENYETYQESMPDDEAMSIWIADVRNRMEK
jgi:tetratricopeptide (TPR) repeat protein